MNIVTKKPLDFQKHFQEKRDWRWRTLKEHSHSVSIFRVEDQQTHRIAVCLPAFEESR